MALNRTKVLEAAQKYLQKGQHDKAIAEYQKLVKEDPRDVRTLLKIGDLHTRRGHNPDAIETYGQVAEQYAKQGFFLKAVAVYKQILKLDPDQLAVSQKLAGMYEELALLSDALNTYESVADGYTRRGDTKAAIETMQKMVELDADNIAVRIKFAEALSRADDTEQAAAAFGAGAALLKEQGRMDDYIRVAERQLYHEAQNVELAKELAGLYLERKDAKRALAKLQLCFKDNPRDIHTLEMLAEAFRQLGQGSKTISVLREIARIHAELGAEEPRKRALSRILDLDPDDQEARQILGAPARGEARQFGATMIDGRSPDERAADAAAREEEDEPELIEDDAALLEDDAEDADDYLLMDDDDEGDEILIVDESGRSEPPPAASPSRREREPETGDERAQRLMAEADVKAAAGLWLEVEGLLEEVLELTPNEVPARERLKDLYLELERNDEAVQQLLLLADAWLENDINRAIGYTQHAASLAPDDPRPRLRLEALNAEAEASAPAALPIDPLDQPIAPDDFGAPPPGRSEPPASADVDMDVDSLLDAPIEDDFGAPPAPAPRDRRSTLADSLPRPSDVDGLLDGTLADTPYDALLDAPIEDDFGTVPPEAREPSLAPEAQSMLDAPIEDDFDAPPPARPSAAATSVDLLDAPIEDDFGAPPTGDTASGAALDASLDALLDAPIEDDFAAPAPPAAQDEALDDFGLTDDRFDQSDLLEIDSEAPAAPQETSEVELFDEYEPADEDRSGDITAQGEVPEGIRAMQIGTEPPPPRNDPDTVEAELPEEALDLATPPLAPEAQEAHDEDEFDDDIEFLEPEPLEDAQAAPGTLPSAPPASLSEAAPREPAQDEPQPAALRPSEPVTAVGPEPEEEIDPEVEETIDEADFFFAQGMFDDAIETVQEALLIYAGNRALQAKLDQYESAAEQAEQEAAEEPAAEEVAAEDDESFRLAEQLAEELGEIPGEGPVESVDVEQVFEQFKKGVAEQVSEDDSATHFDLGIAYKEMGLVDDAMNEFRVASSDPMRRCMALTMIGMCLLEQNEPQRAVAEFHDALASEHKDARAELGLHFEIGAAYEMLADVPKAVAEFEIVARQDSGFRGVKERLERLRKQLPETDEADDLDRAFDDLMGDSD